MAVHAVGTKTAGRHFNVHDTVAVTLRFPGERLAPFTVSFATAPAEGFTLGGTRATLHAAPCCMFGADTGISYTKTTAEGGSEHGFDPVEQFGNEAEYFSACILGDRHPEADGEEGSMDMRVLDAIERSLDTGETVTLEAARRA